MQRGLFLFPSFYQCKDFIVFGKPVFGFLGKDQLVVDFDFKHTAARSNELWVYSKQRIDFGRQTGSAGFVVSNTAIFDGDLHVFLSGQKMA
ncbi:MAG: hypothetical protein ACI9UK_002035 [Candidatus Krumholzibacteriia bacterium]|jgi:hypothetical protein